MASTVALLNTLTDAINSATTAFPTDESTLLPPSEGISLLDVKNDLLLSYLQNLVFLIILRLRNGSDSQKGKQDAYIGEDVIKKLVELRVYMERGVRPLEGRLRYQIDNVLRAAEEVERVSASRKSNSKDDKNKKKTRAKSSKLENRRNSSEDSNASFSEAGSENDSDVESSDDDEMDDEETQEMMNRPGTAAMRQKAETDRARNNKTSSRDKSTAAGASTNGGIYKPPRITPTAMPMPQSSRDQDRDDTLIRRRRKANLVDEYIDEEVSSAPRAQPSIGSNSTILAHGRSGLSARDREKQRERTDYEERNFVRLPAESKAERKKAKARGERDRRDMFGGEDWTGLGGLGDRIHKSVGGRAGAGGGILERREKRKRATEDGPRGDGLGVGEAFDRRRKIMEDRAEKKRRKRG